MTLLARTPGLGDGDDGRALHGLVGPRAETEALVGDGEVAHRLRACCRLGPVDQHARMRHDADDERAAGDGERVRGPRDEAAGCLRARVAGDDRDLPAVGTHQDAGGRDQAGHHVTWKAPSFTLTSVSLTTTVRDPRFRVMPDDASVAVVSLTSVIVPVPPSSSKRILWPAVGA